MNKLAKNTDTKLFEDDNGNSIHKTKEGAIGINRANHVVVDEIENWHEAMLAYKWRNVDEQLPPNDSPVLIAFWGNKNDGPGMIDEGWVVRVARFKDERWRITGTYSAEPAKWQFISEPKST